MTEKEMTLVGKDGDGKVPAQQPKWLERETSIVWIFIKLILWSFSGGYSTSE